MTLIVAVNTPEISLVLGDARLTTSVPQSSKHFDCCQKVFRLSKSTLMAFTGDVATAAEFLTTMAVLRQHMGEEQHDHAVSIQQLVLHHTLRQDEVLEAWRRKDGTLPNIEFVFAGRARPDVPVFQSFRFRLPDGHVELLTQHGITVLGSGKNFFQDTATLLATNLDEYRQNAARQSDPTHFLAGTVEAWISDNLARDATRAALAGRPPHPSFGIILHAMYVDEKGVFPLQGSSTGLMNYDFTPRNDPFSGGSEIRYKNGRFFIRTAAGQSVVLVSPPEYMAHRHSLLPTSERIDPHPANVAPRKGLYQRIRAVFQNFTR